MDRRMQHNELQQVETDTFTGHQRNLLDGQRENFQQLQTRYNNYVRQTDRELVLLEEYEDCVRDSLVCYGGFIRYNKLSRQQRTDMRAQEQSNKVLFPASQVAPDTSDADGGRTQQEQQWDPDPIQHLCMTL